MRAKQSPRKHLCEIATAPSPPQIAADLSKRRYLWTDPTRRLAEAPRDDGIMPFGARNDGSSVNLPNFLTLSRILLAGVLVALLYTAGFTAKLVALAVFVLACWTDYIDGNIARSRNQVTPLGKLLDPIADKLLVFGAFFSFVGLKIMPAWIVFAMLARELGITVFRLAAARKGVALPAEPLGKYKTGFQDFAILLILVFFLLQETSAWNAAWDPGVLKLIHIMMLFVLLITLWSGFTTITKNWKELRTNVIARRPEGLTTQSHRETFFADRFAPSALGITKAVVSVFYIGHIPLASGTFASLAACAAVLFFESSGVTVGLGLATLAIGLFLSAPAGKAYEKSDPSEFVLDEWCGMCLALAFLPLNWPVAVAAFFLFRFFDIFKPLGIRKLDQWNHPFSIMADDVLAGLYTNLTVQIAVRFFPALFLR